jgi:competence protein ComGF
MLLGNVSVRVWQAQLHNLSIVMIIIIIIIIIIILPLKKYLEHQSKEGRAD